MIIQYDNVSGNYLAYYSKIKCCRCHEVKDESEYVRCDRYRSGYFSHCKKCDNLRKKPYYENNKQILNAKTVKRKKESGYNDWFKNQYKDRIALLRKKSYEKLKLDPVRFEKRKAKANERRRYRFNNDPVFAFSMRARGRISNALRRKEIEKTQKFDELLGCSHRQAVHYLTNGNFEIPKESHIDHYVPVAYFNLEDANEQKICFNWRNLRLIPAKENFSKNAKLPADYKERIAEICRATGLTMEVR